MNSSMQTLQDISAEFKRLLIGFLDELIEQFPNEGDLVIARVFLKDQIPITIVLNYFLQELLPHKTVIEQRDEQFFLQNDILFGALNKDKVGHFRKLWRSPALDNQDRDLIWQWFDGFIRLTERYKHAMDLATRRCTNE